MSILQVLSFSIALLDLCGLASRIMANILPCVTMTSRRQDFQSLLCVASVSRSLVKKSDWNKSLWHVTKVNELPFRLVTAWSAGKEINQIIQRTAGTTSELRDTWEATSFQFERLQCAAECVSAEQSGLASREAPEWNLPYMPRWTPQDTLASTSKADIAVIRSKAPIDSKNQCFVPLACQPF